MREFTIIEIKATDQELEKIKESKYLKFNYKDSRIPLYGNLKSIEDNILTASTQGHYENVSLGKVDKGTVVQLEIGRAEAFIDGIVLNRYFEKTTKKDWKVSQELTIENSGKEKCHLQLSQEEKEWLEYGFIPLQMEDKWFVYMENDEIHFLRSWTGIEFFSAQLIANQDNWIIKTVRVAKEFSGFNKANSFKDLIEWRLKWMRRIMTKTKK